MVSATESFDLDDPLGEAMAWLWPAVAIWIRYDHVAVRRTAAAPPLVTAEVLVRASHADRSSRRLYLGKDGREVRYSLAEKRRVHTITPDRPVARTQGRPTDSLPLSHHATPRANHHRPRGRHGETPRGH
jgi:hypothetical protein